jgi:hypothetical protein
MYLLGDRDQKEESTRAERELLTTLLAQFLYSFQLKDLGIAGGRNTCAPSILSLMRSPISFINALPLSLSLKSAQATLCNVEERSFLMYGFN